MSCARSLNHQLLCGFILIVSSFDKVVSTLSEDVRAQMSAMPAPKLLLQQLLKASQTNILILIEGITKHSYYWLGIRWNSKRREGTTILLCGDPTAP